MELATGYKLTAVGVLPEEWAVKSIGDLYLISAGGDFKPDHASDFPDDVYQYPVYSNALTDAGLYGYCDYADHKADSVTVTARGMIGSANFRDHPFTAIGRVLVLEPRAPQDGRFTVAYINERMDIAVESTGVPQLTAPQFSKYLLPVPPLPEQRAIAAALGDVDGLIGALEALIAKKRDIKQAAMQQLLTGKTRLPGFEGEWVETLLGDLGSCNRGVTYNPEIDLRSHDASDTYRLLRANNIFREKINLDDVQFVNRWRVSLSQYLETNDILICIANGSRTLVGKAGIFTKNDEFHYTYGAFMGRFRTNTAIANPYFVFSMMQTHRYRNFINDQLAGSSINNLRPSAIERLSFKIPRHEEQAAIAAVLSDMDAEIAALEARRDKTKALKQGMMQELLTGRIRLV